MSELIDVKLIDKDTFTEKMDALILSVAMGSSGASNVGKFSSYSQLQTLIRSGLGKKILPVETQLTIERETSITISIGDSTGITGATIDEDTFLAKVGESHSGIYEAHFDGAVWHKEDESNIDLAEYGIQVTGTPAEGDHIVVKETTSKLVFDVLDHDRHTFKNTHLNKGVVIGMHNVFTYGTIPFCPSQLLYYAANGLAAGKYKVTLYKGQYGGGTSQDGTYVFTLTQAVPAGGGIRHTTMGGYQSSYNKGQITGGKFRSYGAAPERTQIEEVVCTEYNADTDSDAIDLGTFSARDKAYLTASNNVTERQYYGNHRWKYSIYRQWLNSTARAWKSGDGFSNWYSPQTNFDMPPSETVRKMAGFLHGIDAGLLQLIQPVEVKTALSDTDKVNSGDYDITYDRIWLQSQKEVFGSDNTGVAEGVQFEYWRVHNTNADRIKYEGTTARYWWLRSPYPSYASYVRDVLTDGSLDNGSAYSSYGVVPACVIG